MDKSSINIVVIGDVGSGKSSTAAHLIHRLGGIEQRLVKRFEKEASERRRRRRSRECLKYSWVLNKLESEKDRGISIDNTIGKIETDNYWCTVIDAPGHPDSIKDTITAMSQADVALLIIDSTSSDFKVGTFEHALLAYGLGVKNIIPCCNKMDDIGYSQERYNAIVGELTSCLKGAGYKNEPGHGEFVFIPISSLRGDNLIKSSTELGWHTGPTLLEAIDSISKPSRPVNNPLRIPIQQFHKILGVGTIAVGRVQAGELKRGMEVTIGPTGLATTVKSIEMHGYDLDIALPGDNIRFNLGNIPIKDLEQGHVVSDSNFIPAMEAVSFTATVMMKKCRKPITKGYTVTMHCNMCYGTIKLDELTSIIDGCTGVVIENQPKSLKNGEVGIVKMIPTRRMVVETYFDCPPLGRFVLRDTQHTIAIGIIKSVEKKDLSTEMDMPPRTIEESRGITEQQERSSTSSTIQKVPTRRRTEEPSAHFVQGFGRNSLSGNEVNYSINMWHSHLHEDVLTLVLVRLPVNSLGRFKCVSKSWKALISSRGFIKLHLHQSCIDRNPPSILVWKDVLDNRGRRTSVQIYAVEFLMDSGCKFEQFHDPIESMAWTFNKDIVGCCNGLLCLIIWSNLALSCDAYVYAICLWNPLTKSIWSLPLSKHIGHQKKDISFYGFGYDDMNDDYKVIIASRCRNKPVEDGGYVYEVYSLRSDSWSKEISYINSGLLSGDQGGVSVNCALHWLFSSSYGKKSILTIDLRTDIHRFLPLPEEALEKLHLRLVVLNGCLLLIDNYYGQLNNDLTYKFDMWMMKECGSKDSWTRISIHNMPNDVDVGCTIPVALSESNKVYYYYYLSNDGIIFLLYDLVSNQVLGRTISSSMFGGFKDMRHQFVGSLVQPQPPDQYIFIRGKKRCKKFTGNALMDMHDLLRSRRLAETLSRTKKRSRLLALHC